jgi:hypothetical protein
VSVFFSTLFSPPLIARGLSHRAFALLSLFVSRLPVHVGAACRKRSHASTLSLCLSRVCRLLPSHFPQRLGAVVESVKRLVVFARQPFFLSGQPDLSIYFWILWRYDCRSVRGSTRAVETTSMQPSPRAALDGQRADVTMMPIRRRTHHDCHKALVHSVLYNISSNEPRENTDVRSATVPSFTRAPDDCLGVRPSASNVLTGKLA